jgi:septum formation protein
MPLRLVLASTSPFRRELLSRLQIPFVVAAPETDETAHAAENPAETAMRLAEAKARAVAAGHPGALIIGSDQVAALGSEHFGKPHTKAAAAVQLRRMSGKEIVFHTGLCLLNTNSNVARTCVIPVSVGFRELTDAEIAAYIEKEDALNCAGSAKSEGLGISLLRYLRGDDPNALIGLPLIALCDMLRAEGVSLP